jgi:glycosyltransferase involved in cell wall biosynthesis
MSPRFSVIIPTYNRAETILESLDSVFAQTRPADQILVIDDGSSDNTAEVIRPVMDRITYIPQENGGVSVARNTGLQHATGDWITFLDSDDLWDPERLAILERDIATTREDVGVHWANLRITGEGYDWDIFGIKGKTFPKGRAEIVEKPLKMVLGGTSPQSLACRKSWADTVGGFDPEARISGDTHFATLLALQGPWMVTADSVAEVRRIHDTEEGLRQMARRKPLYRAEMKTMLLDRVAAHEMSASDRMHLRRHMAMAAFTLADAQQEAGQSAEARKTLIRAAKIHPSSWRGWTKALIPLTLGNRGFSYLRRRAVSYDRL